MTCNEMAEKITILTPSRHLEIGWKTPKEEASPFPSSSSSGEQDDYGKGIPTFLEVMKGARKLGYTTPTEQSYYCRK